MSGNGALERVRLDRWLFSVRIFKTRGQAVKALAGGRVKVNGVTAKPHKLLRIGDVIQYKHEGRLFEYRVLGLRERRVGAKDAAPCYGLTEDADLEPNVRELVQLYREADRKAEKSRGRPSKRDRRVIDRLRGREEE